MGIGPKIFFIDFLSNIGREGLNNIENMWHICSKDRLIFFQNIPVIVFSLLGNVFAMILPNTFFSWFEMGVFVNSSQKKRKKVIIFYLPYGSSSSITGATISALFGLIDFLLITTVLSGCPSSGFSVKLIKFSVSLIVLESGAWWSLSLECTPLDVSLWLLPGGSGGEWELSVLTESDLPGSSSCGMIPESALRKQRELFWT